VKDTTWSTIVGTWRPGRLELYGLEDPSPSPSNGAGPVMDKLCPSEPGLGMTVEGRRADLPWTGVDRLVVTQPGHRYHEPRRHSQRVASFHSLPKS
jgi:hypothetical protein